MGVTMGNEYGYLKSLAELSEQLSHNPQDNINLIVAKTHQLLGGVCALYNKLNRRDQSLISWAAENAPDTLPKSDTAAGHICYEATIKGKDKIIVLPDISKTEYQNLDPYVSRYGLKAYLGAPVQVKDDAIGSLCIVDTKTRHFTPSEIFLIRHLATLLKQEEVRRALVKNQEIIFNISKSLSSSKNIEELYSTIQDAISDFLKIDDFIFLFRTSNDGFQILQGQSTDLYNGLDDCLIKKILNQRQSILLNREKIRSLVRQYQFKQDQPTSWLGVPIIYDDESIYGLFILKTYGNYTYIPEDQRLVDLISQKTKHIIKEKLLKSEIRSHEKLYKSIFDQLPLGIYRTDFNGNILMVNSILVAMLEYDSMEELTKINISSQYHPDYKRESFLKQLIEKGVIKNKKSIWVTKKGKKLFIRETAKLIKLNGAYYIGGTVEDITQDIKHKNAYQFEKEKYKNLSENVPIGILHVNHDGKILGVNQQFTKITGLKKKRFHNINQFYDLLETADHQPKTDQLSTSSTHEIMTPEGIHKYIKISKTESVEHKYLLIIEDITETIFSRQALIKQSEYLKAINQVANLMISEDKIPYERILGIIGNTVNVSRVIYFEIKMNGNDLTGVKKAVWDKRRRNETQFPTEINITRKMPNLFKKIDNTPYFYANSADFFQPEKSFFEQYNIKSMFIMQSKIANKPIGFFVLEDLEKERIWSNNDVVLMNSIVSNIAKIKSQNIVKRQLEKSKISYRELFHNSISGIVIFDKNGVIQNINPIAKQFFNVQKDVVGLSVDSIVNADVAARIKKAVSLCFNNICRRLMDTIIRNNNHFHVIDFHFTKGTYLAEECVIMYGHDITIRFKREEKIRENLAEKQILLQEIHHRVKNNLQIISSLLNLQLPDLETEKDRELFLDSQNRIKSIAQIHESLYHSENFSRIKFKTYAKNLMTRLFSVFKVNTNQIFYELSFPEIELDLKKAIPCGLILDELITNALKYAFPHQQEGKIIVELRKEKGYYYLKIKDNGVGFDISIIEKKKSSLGMTLILTLTKQLKGEYTVFSDNGFGMEIKFPAD